MPKESDLQTLFAKYNKVKRIDGNFEFKDSLGKPSVSYDSFEEQQIPSLLAAQVEGLQWKYSDADPRLKPFDYSSNKPLLGWVGIRFKKTTYLILVEAFIEHRDKSTRKSITEKECEEIAIRQIEL